MQVGGKRTLAVEV